MTLTRIRHAAATAIVVTAIALLPGSAGAHPVDCDSGPLAMAPTAERFSSIWTASNGCTVPTLDRAESIALAARMARPVPAIDRKSGSLSQVGHEPLLNRGMNAAIAVHGNFAYIGSRTDAHEGTPHGGVMVVDVSDPSDPELVGPPFDAKPGESSRELRVWRSQNILIVLNTNCGVGPALHHCTRPSISNFRFYDISGDNAAHPRLLNQFDVDTHEFFLWEDPKNPRRALIFGGAAASTCATRGGAPSCPFSVWDISSVRNGQPPATLYSGLYPYTRFPAEPEPVQKPTGGLHSLTISNDGRRAYFAMLTGGFAVVDVSEFAAGAPLPQPHPITDNAARPTWAGPGAHSAVNLWGRDWAWVSDEVYGVFTGPGHGCPWGWARIVDISNPRVPAVKAEYREPENNPSTCDQFNPPKTSYSAHNPTLNGLYVLKYRGAFEKEVQRIRFLDGNSNQGDALCFDPVGTAPASCG